MEISFRYHKFLYFSYLIKISNICFIYVCVCVCVCVYVEVMSIDSFYIDYPVYFLMVPLLHLKWFRCMSEISWPSYPLVIFCHDVIVKYVFC